MRFQDHGEHLALFAGYYWVHCPKCEEVIRHYRPRLRCVHCGFSKEMQALDAVARMYLVTNCCGEELWAYNQEHLDFLEAYVAADLRERKPNVNSSMASRLPKWMKDRKNRKDVLKGLQRLREKLEAIEG